MDINLGTGAEKYAVLIYKIYFTVCRELPVNPAGTVVVNSIKRGPVFLAFLVKMCGSIRADIKLIPFNNGPFLILFYNKIVFIHLVDAGNSFKYSTFLQHGKRVGRGPHNIRGYTVITRDLHPGTNCGRKTQRKTSQGCKQGDGLSVFFFLERRHWFG